MPEDMWSTFSKVTKDTLAKFLKDNELCPQPKANEIAFAINTRLNPSTTYTVQFNVKDIYGNTLAPITKTFVT